jgi:hypothetical protein
MWDWSGRRERVCDGTGTEEESPWLGRRDGKKFVIGLGEKEKSLWLVSKRWRRVSLMRQGEKEESV